MRQEELDLTSLKDALEQLEKATWSKPRNDLERDGVIQRFEYTFELCWKMIRKYFLVMGRPEVSASPKPLLRDAFSEGLIESDESLERWFAFLAARNETSHIYDKKIAEDVFQKAEGFAAFARKLVFQLDAKLGK